MRYTIWIVNTNDQLEPNESSTGLKNGYKIYDTNWTGVEPKLVEADISEQIGMIAKVTFTIDKSNPYYDELISRVTQVWIYEEDIINERNNEHNVLFAGHIVSITESISRDGIITKQVTCADHTDYLNDTIVPRQSYWLTLRSAIGQISQFAENDHNDQVTHIEGSQGDPNVKCMYFNFSTTVPQDYNNYEYVVNWDTTYRVVREIMDRFGYEWYVEPYKEELEAGSGNYFYRMIVMVTDKIGKTSSVKLQDGVNIQSLTVQKDETNVVTRLFPLGSTNDDGSVVTIPSEEGDTGDIHVSDRYNAIDNETAIERYGIISGINTWDDVTLPANLKTKGKSYIANKCGVKVQYSGTFLDLAGKDPQNRFCLGDTHRLVHSLLGIDETVRIVGLKRDLLRPWNVELTLGDIFYNAEQQRYRETQSLQSQINETYKHMGGNS